MTEPLRYSFKTEPYKHQRKALARIWKLAGRAGVWLPMRTGKTKIAIDWAGLGYHNMDVRRVVIVCPIHVISVWQDQIAEHLPSSVPWQTIILRHTAKKNAETMRTLIPKTKMIVPHRMLQLVIVNYEMVWRVLHEEGPRGGKVKTSLDEIIAQWAPDLLIIDEAHKIKQYTSRQSLALARLGKASRQVLALTGTPSTKWPLDLWAIFRAIDGDLPDEQRTFTQRKWRCWNKDRYHVHSDACDSFSDHYAVWTPTRHTPNVDEVTRYQNMDELVERVRKHSYSIRLEDAFPDLPERTVQDIRVKMSPAARRVYDDMANEMIAWLDKQPDTPATAKNVLEKIIRLSQITSGFVKDENKVEHDIDDAKERACIDLIEDMLEQDEKVVVFCWFVHDYHRLARAFDKRRWGYAQLTGETPEKRRPLEITRFRDDPDTRIFIAQMQSGSVGIDLSAARLCIFYSLTYNWADYAQAGDRILDPRRPRPLGIYRLLVPNTVDMIQKRVLDERGDMASAIIHGPRNLLTAA